MTGVQTCALPIWGDARIQLYFHDHARIVSLAGTDLVLAPTERLQPDFHAALAARLKDTTGQRWTVRTGEGAHQPSMRDIELAEEDAAKTTILESPLVQATLRAFPEAELVDYSAPEPRSLAS